MPKIISIISPPYSGSTLLTFLLAAHPDVATIGERKKFHNKILASNSSGSNLCSCGVHFHQCAFWTTVRNRLLDRSPHLVEHHDFSAFHLFEQPRLNRLARNLCLSLSVHELSYLLPAPLKQRLTQVLNSNRYLIEEILAVAGGSAFLDSSKSVMQALFLDSLEQFDSYVIHLIRDGRAQVNSAIKHHPQQSVSEAARGWVKTITHQQRLLSLWKGRVITIHYERLCAMPEETVKEITTFVRLSGEVDIETARVAPQHIMGNPMRLSTINAIYDKQEWRTNLTSQQLAAITRIAGGLNRALGYQE